MPEYEHGVQRFRPGDGETGSIPADAIGVTVSTFGDPEGDGLVTAHYLVPAEADGE